MGKRSKTTDAHPEAVRVPRRVLSALVRAASHHLDDLTAAGGGSSSHANELRDALAQAKHDLSKTRGAEIG